MNADSLLLRPVKHEQSSSPSQDPLDRACLTSLRKGANSSQQAQTQTAARSHGAVVNSDLCVDIKPRRLVPKHPQSAPVAHVKTRKLAVSRDPWIWCCRSSQPQMAAAAKQQVLQSLVERPCQGTSGPSPSHSLYVDTYSFRFRLAAADPAW